MSASAPQKDAAARGSKGVITVEIRSQSRLIKWNSSWPVAWAKGWYLWAVARDQRGYGGASETASTR